MNAHYDLDLFNGLAKFDKSVKKEAEEQNEFPIKVTESTLEVTGRILFLVNQFYKILQSWWLYLNIFLPYLVVSCASYTKLHSFLIYPKYLVFWPWSQRDEKQTLPLRPLSVIVASSIVTVMVHSRLTA